MRRIVATLCGVIFILVITGCWRESSPRIAQQHVVKTPLTRDLVLSSDSISLTLDASGVPLSLKLNDEREILNQKLTKGFYLNVPGVGVVELNKVSSADQYTVFATEDDSFEAYMKINATPHYIAFTLMDVQGELPANSRLIFSLTSDPTIAVFPFDYAITNRSINAKIDISFTQIASANKSNHSLGGFAIYHFNSPEEQDERILRIWGAERVPHPKVEGWSYERAKQWIQEWIDLFHDQSVMYISARSVDELNKFQPYLDKAQVKMVYLFTDVWQNGGFWPTSTLNWGVGPQSAFKTEEAFRDYVVKQMDKGQLVTLHYVSGGIGFNDPQYAGSQLSDQLASWVDGTLVQDITVRDNEIQFKPANDSDIMPTDLNSHSKKIGKLSMPLNQSLFHYEYLQIGSELMKINSFSESDDGNWTIRVHSRGHNGTKSLDYVAGTTVKGLIIPYDAVYIPDYDSPLLVEMAEQFASFLNRNHIYNTTYDGAEIHNYTESGFNKFAQHVYENLDHPVITHTSLGKVPERGYIEYQLNQIKKYDTGPKGDHNAGRASLTLERKDTTYGELRPTTQLLEANFMLSTQAAYQGENYSILRPDPMFGITLNELETYGRTDELLSLLPAWKDVGSKLTEEQRAQMQSTFVRKGHITSRIAYNLQQNAEEYRLVPTGVMDHADAAEGFHMKQEGGVFAPRVETNLGTELSLVNPYASQSPQFIIHVKSVAAGGIEDMSVELGTGGLTVEGILESSQYIEYSGGETANLYDNNWKLIRTLPTRIHGNFTVEEGNNLITLKSNNNLEAKLNLQILTVGDPIIVMK